MAKNWTVSEAVQEINKGNKAAILDIGKRYPLFANLVAGALSGNVESTVELLESLPEYNTANKINGRLKEGIESEETEDDETEVDEKPAKKESKKETTSESEDYESMGAYPLYQLCKKRGIEVKSKRPKDEYVAALKAADGEGSDEESDDETSENEYEGKSAQELFKLAKSRKIKVEPKKPAKYYIQKLEEADATETEGSDEDDWGDENEEEKPAKKDSKKETKPTKPAKQTEDEDEEWDI